MLNLSVANSVNPTPWVMGISCYYHDSAATLLCGSEIVAAAQEERFTRRKFDANFPYHAIHYCLEEGGIKPSDLSFIAFYEEPYVKLHRLVEILSTNAPFQVFRNSQRVVEWLGSKMDPEPELAHALDGFTGPVGYFHHHLSHAASSFYPSPFDKATILTVDGVGEWACTSVSVGNGSSIEVLVEQRFPHSVGLLYSAFTQYLGFKVDSGEYKVMGLAPYGMPRYQKLITEKLLQVDEDGAVELNLEYFDFLTGSRMINEKFHSLFGRPPRQPDDPLTETDMDLACSIQRVLEDIMLKLVRYAVKHTGLRTLCLAGGVALNCVANGKILTSGLVDQMWIQPAAGDAGGALGAAFLGLYQHLGLPRRVEVGARDKQKGSFLGPSFSRDQIQSVLDAYGMTWRQLSQDEWASTVASLLAHEKVVGFFQGRMEFGPRALGARSILADPRSPRMQRDLNLKIKFRESFRPFAPVVLRERMAEWFALNADSPYMLLTTELLQKWRTRDSVEKETALLPQKGIEQLRHIRSRIPAVTHVDYSARVQTVDERTNHRLYTVLRAFEDLTGCPVLVNTSFNVRGEPIVCSPIDALRCFMNTNIDVLIIEDFLVTKKNAPHMLQDPEFRNHFARQD